MIFVVRHDAKGDVLLEFDGMNTGDVTAMFALDGVSFDFLSQADYQARRAALPPVVKGDPPNVAAAKALLKTPAVSADAKIQALITILGLN